LPECLPWWHLALQSLATSGSFSYEFGRHRAERARFGTVQPWKFGYRDWNDNRAGPATAGLGFDSLACVGSAQEAPATLCRGLVDEIVC
jgi:hypothetical protein